jgi:hypothetical protein
MSATLQVWAGAGPTSMTTLALVFTDIIGSTDLAVKNGDKKWIEILTTHFRQARRIKDICNGYEIKLIGDACMVAFRTATDAFQFAWQFYNDTGHSQIQIRIAIHVGQVRIVENDIYGLMVNYTSRVQQLLPGLGIMLSDIAKNDIVAELGKDIPEFSLIPVRKTIESFGTQKLWFVGKKLTPLQESVFGKTFRKAILNESDLIPPVPDANKVKIGDKHKSEVVPSNKMKS